MNRRLHAQLLVATGLVGAGLAWLAWARWSTFHNETFDLALYARMAWGWAHLDLWDPLVDAHFWGVHVSPVLAPLGLLGRATSTVPVLLVAQVAAAMAAAWPLARVGYRRFGPNGALAGAAAFLLQPNLSHALTYEFHPGTLAVLPLAWALDALDRRDGRALVVASLGMLFCREDTALVTAMLGALAALTVVELRRTGVALAVGSLAYFLAFVLWLNPTYAPAAGSLQAHFGQWGSSFGQVLAHLVRRPGEVIAAVTSPERVAYLAALIAPVALLPLLRGRWLLVAAGPLAMNLLSRWPTSIALDSHYQTILLPVLVVAALDGARTLSQRWRGTALAGLVLCSFGGQVLAGGTPLARHFDRTQFEQDDRARAAAAVVGAVPDGASVQAPHALLAHLAERHRVYFAPPPERETEYVLLDAWHRQAWAHRETFLRTDQEPVVRDWLARDDYGLVAAAGSFLLLERGAPPRAGPASRYLRGRARRPERGTRLASCLGLVGAWVEDDDLVLELIARERCPADLGLRIGTLERPDRVDPLFDGLLSPAHLRRGDLLVSRHPFGRAERLRWGRYGVRVGLLRSSGARPAPTDPVSVPVPLPREAFREPARSPATRGGA